MNIPFPQYAIISLLMLCLTLQLETIAQTEKGATTKTNNNYAKFKSELEAEFGVETVSDLDDIPSNINRVFFKTELPDWIFELPKSNDSIVFVIGVSEPGMTKDTAYQLAVLRAKTMCAIITNSKMNGLSDYYISEKDLNNGDIISSVYREFNKIVCNISFNDADFTIVKDTFTINNEAIVLASLRLGNILSANKITVDCLAEVSSSHMKKNRKNSSTARTELMATEVTYSIPENSYFYYVVKRSNKQIKIISDFLGVSLPSNTDLMTYQSSEINENIDKMTNVSCTLQHGLWHALSTVLLQTLVLEFQESDVAQSGLSEQHSNLSQNINRLHSKKEVSLRLKALQIQNNNLQLEVDFTKQD